MMMKNVVSGNNLALKKVAPLTYIQGNFSDCKLIASIQKSVLLLFTLTWSPKLLYSSRMANLIERQRQKSDTQKFLSWRWYTIGLNLYEVASLTLDFSTQGFSTMNSSTQNPFGVEKFMVEWPGVEKSGVEMSCYLLEFGHFNPKTFNHEFF